MVRAEGAERAPVDTGTLADSMIAVLRTSENAADEITVRVGPSKRAFYGLFEEIGTAHSTPDPFLMPAYDDKKDDALKITSSEFIKSIEEVSRKG